VGLTATLADLGVEEKAPDLDFLIENHGDYERDAVRERLGFRWNWLRTEQKAYVASHPSDFILSVVTEGWRSDKRIDFEYGKGPSEETMKAVGLNSRNTLVVIATPALRAKLEAENREQRIQSVMKQNTGWALEHFLAVDEETAKLFDRLPFTQEAFEKSIRDNEKIVEQAQSGIAMAKTILQKARLAGGFDKVTERFRQSCADTVDGKGKTETAAS